MGRVLWLVFLVLLLCSTAVAGEWSNKDKALFTTFGVMLFVDYLQTNYILSSDDYEEKNPVIREVFGRDYTWAYFSLVGLGSYLIVDTLPEKYRAPLLAFANVVQIGVIGNNFMIGVGFEF